METRDEKNSQQPKPQADGTWSSSRFTGLQPPRPSDALARDYERSAVLAELCGDLARAETHLARATALFAAEGDEAGLCTCLLRRGWMALRQGRDDDAHRLAVQAEPLATRGACLDSLALLQARLGLGADPDLALRRANAVLRDDASAAIPWLRVEAFIVIGQACAALRRCDEAVVACRKALDVLEDLPPEPAPSAPLPYCMGQAEFYAELEGILADLVPGA